MKNCLNCPKDTPDHLNYCSWECHVDDARKNGCEERLPNGLPVRCITATGLLLECEGGEHPDYKFPVEADYVGPKENDDFTWVGEGGTVTPMTDIEAEGFKHQTHALIYCDGSVAITTYECCYAMWYVSSGEFAGGSLWRKGEWKLTDKSLDQIRSKFRDPE